MQVYSVFCLGKIALGIILFSSRLVCILKLEGLNSSIVDGQTYM